MTASLVDDMHESSNFDTNGGVKTNQEKMQSQQENNLNGHQDQENLAASSNAEPSHNAAKKKRSRTGYWKDKKAAWKQTQAAAEGDMNENGGVSTSMPTEKAETHITEENDHPGVNENADTQTFLPLSVEAPTVPTPTKPKAKSKNGKKAKSTSHITPIQDQWPSLEPLEEDFVSGGWDESVTQSIWRIENEIKHTEEGTKAKNTKPKKKVVKSKGDPEAQKTGSEPLSLRAGNIDATMDANGPNGAKLGEDGIMSTKETVVSQPKEAKKKVVKKKKTKADKSNIHGEPETLNPPDFVEGDGSVDKETQHTASTIGVDINGGVGVNGSSPSKSSGSHDQSLDDKVDGIKDGTNGNTEMPMPETSSPKEKPKQMKIQVDLDLELAAVLKAKVKGEMMITFMN